MDIKDFQSGRYEKRYCYSYFLPSCINHPFYWSDPQINDLLEQASVKLGELNSLSRFVPDIRLFTEMHTRKEAVVSSRIEGTQTTIEEACTNEEDIAPQKRDDWMEVKNYVDALNDAINQLERLPISSRLIRKAHRIMLRSVRGEHKNPGEFRRSQNWIGGATLADAVFIPPAHTEIPELMSDLEKFINNQELNTPHLVKAAIMHYQFETIHPFLDGNGRVGRLLIPLYLIANNLLDKPLLYLSEFFERHRSIYYDKLTIVREKNDLGQWIKFFLVGVIETTGKSITTLTAVSELKARIETHILPQMGRRARNAGILLNHLFQYPVVTVSDVQRVLGLTPKSANDMVSGFVEHSILVPMNERRRNRMFVFKEYVQMFGR